MFTIEVKKKRKDEEFSFKDLEMSHQECLGGRIKKDIEGRTTTVEMVCQRCERMLVVRSGEGTFDIILTAMDGQKRKVRVEKATGGDLNVYVIQKT